MDDKDVVDEFIERVNNILRVLQDVSHEVRSGRADNTSLCDAYYLSKAEIKDEFEYVGRRMRGE
jgi:hypothetical protein